MNQIDIKYDQPIEVTKEQYYKITSSLGMIVAHRINKGKYFVKLWDMRYIKHLNHLLQ